MFKRFAAFQIAQAKITWLVIGILLAVGVFSWITIAKQYNPSIVVPAFQLTIGTPGFSRDQVNKLITQPIENSFKGIQGVEHVYARSSSDGAQVMVTFYVGINKETATTRIHNAMNNMLPSLPAQPQNIHIQAIDPDEIPIFSFAVVGPSLETDDDIIQKQLKTIALDIVDQLKVIADTTVWYTLGGQADNIYVTLDLDRLTTRQGSIGQLMQTLENQYITYPVGAISMGNTQATIRLKGSNDSLEDIRHLSFPTSDGGSIRLGDIATITTTNPKAFPHVIYTTSEQTTSAITIGVAKQIGTNAASITKTIQEKLKEIEPSLPEGYSLVIIQDEGAFATETTNMLLINLFQSILIVSLVLGVFLGGKRAINVAISIPLTLSVVFLFILLIGDNINRITLFALILMLGMLVDDATVVVENMSRHLNLRTKTNKTKIEAILDAIGEVELGVILSTVTRLLSFVAMFFVTGMMGDYMGPIPKYAIVTMIASTTIALSINPFLARAFEKDIILTEESTDTKATLRNRITAFRQYLRDKRGDRYHLDMESYLSPEGTKKRKKFKRFFWIILGITVIVPIFSETFRARMLPKSDQNQIYVWVDAPADSSLDFSTLIAKDINTFLQTYMVNQQQEGTGTDTALINSITWRIGTPPMLDFSNLFRGSQGRNQPFHISARINLIEKSQRTITSESFTMTLRNELQQYIKDTYPGTEIRLLEDPPGPPTRATFLLEIGSNELPYETLQTDAHRLMNKLYGTLDAFEVKDLGISDDGWQTRYTIQLDQERLVAAGISTKQIQQTLGVLFGGAIGGVLYDDIHRTPRSLIIAGDKKQLGDKSDFAHILIPTPQGTTIPLTELATIIPEQQESMLYSDDKVNTVYIYGEMGNNSVIYPVIGLYKLFKSKTFREGVYTYKSSDFYGFTLEHTATKQEVRITLGGEWELTMNTFRDMGIAMIISFLGIYFIMTIQFGSFSIGGTIMISFLLGFFGVFPGYALLYLISGEYFSATSMIGVIALAGIVVGNAVLLIEYVMILLNNGNTIKMALIHAGRTRTSPILITSLTTILGATTILGDPVWSGVARAIILGLSSSALLTTYILPIFLYDQLHELEKFDHTLDQV